jgi:hypothetical protein
MSSLLGISEPEPNVPGQGDAEAVRVGYRCCTRSKMSSLLGILEPEPGVQGQGDGKALELFINVVYALLKCRLCFGFQSLNWVCETRERLERVIDVVYAVKVPTMLSLF